MRINAATATLMVLDAAQGALLDQETAINLHIGDAWLGGVNLDHE
jgi:hypothetical protein